MDTRAALGLFALTTALLTACGASPAGGDASSSPDARDGAMPPPALDTGRDDASTPMDSGPPPGNDSATATDTSSAPDGAMTGTGVAALEGFWVWKQTIEGGMVRQDITMADLTWMVGPSGWPGCPSGISCTRYGIVSVAFDASGRAHQRHRVVTGSDTQHPGTFTVDGDVLTYERRETYSCAHPPGGTGMDRATGYARFRRMGDDLWLSVGGFGGFVFASARPTAEPTRWIVFRRITAEEFHGRYDHPYCGAARKGVPSCHALCATRSVFGG